ncbi:MAG: GldM family protein [Bacteroidota bacterium]|nr:GldM family protein [Bacteroidota bacterium]
MKKNKILLAILMILGSPYLNGQTIDSAKLVIAIDAFQYNLLYVGVVNPVDIAVSGIPSDKIKIITDNGIVTGENGHYFFRPDKLAPCNISIIYNDKIIGRRSIRVKTMNAPLIVTIAGKTGGEIEKDKLLGAGALNAEFNPADIFVPANVVAFRIISVVDGYVKDLKKTGNAFNTEMIDFIKKLPSGSPLFIEGIKVLSGDGVTRDVDALSFKIK